MKRASDSKRVEALSRDCTKLGPSGIESRGFHN